MREILPALTPPLDAGAPSHRRAASGETTRLAVRF